MTRLRARIDWPLATLGIAFLIPTVVYGLHIVAVGSQRDAQFTRLQTEIRHLENRQSALQHALDDDDKTIAAIHRQALLLARAHHVTREQLRHLADRSQPRTVVVPSPAPGPTVTVTSTPRQRPPHHRKPRHHPTPTPGCTVFTFHPDQCPSPIPTVPLSVPSLRLG